MKPSAAAVLPILLLCACSSNPPAKVVEVKKSEPAPAQFNVTFDTSKGPFVVEVHRDWAPHGADRFYELVTGKFFDGDRFFRVIKGFVAQWGLNGNPDENTRWRDMAIPDDPVRQSNRRGYITFAKSGPNTRTTQMFINFQNNTRLDADGFAAFGKVTQGMDVVDSIYTGYREDPQQNMIEARGNDYLTEHYPKLDYIKTAKITP